MKKIIVSLAAAMCCTAGAMAALAADTLRHDTAIDTTGVKTAIDTLATADKYRKVILFSDNTWAYVDLDRPAISDEDFADSCGGNCEGCSGCH